MHHVASVISSRKLGYYVDIVSDGTLFIGAFSITGGGADCIPGTGSRSLAETLRHVERHLGLAGEAQSLAYWEDIAATDPQSVTYAEWQAMTALRNRAQGGET